MLGHWGDGGSAGEEQGQDASTGPTSLVLFVSRILENNDLIRQVEGIARSRECGNQGVKLLTWLEKTFFVSWGRRVLRFFNFNPA